MTTRFSDIRLMSGKPPCSDGTALPGLSSVRVALRQGHPGRVCLRSARRPYIADAKSQVLGCLLLLCLPFGASADQKSSPLPKDLPPYGPLTPFRAPNVEVKALDNGLTVWLVPQPGFPKAAFALSVLGGRAADPADRPGLSELLLAAIDQGTATRNAREIAQELQASGGDLAGQADPDALELVTEVLSSKVGPALSVIADLTQNATFPDTEVELAKRNAADNLSTRESDPHFLARRALARALFGTHPYSVIAPTQDSIANTTAEELRREYTRRYRPDRALLVAVGDFDPASLMSEINRLFGKWARPGTEPVPLASAPPQSNPHQVIMVPRPGSVQTTLVLGSFTPSRHDPDFAAAQVADAIYGYMFGSRLVLNIREDKGYTYSPFALLQTYRTAGLLRTQADVRNAVTGPSLNEIDYELNRMATTSPSEDELIQAKTYLVGNTVLGLQAVSAVASELASLWSIGLPPKELGRATENVDKVTVKDVDAVAVRYFPACRQTIVAVGEEPVMRQQLAVFGLPLRQAE